MKKFVLTSSIILTTISIGAASLADKKTKEVNLPIGAVMKQGSGQLVKFMGAYDARGVFPGDKGYLKDGSNQKVQGGEFTVAFIEARMVSAEVGLTSTIDGGFRGIVQASNKKCTTPAVTKDLTGLADALSGKKEMPGYISREYTVVKTEAAPGFVDVKIRINAGFKDGILPRSDAWVAMPPVKAEIRKVGSDWAEAYVRSVPMATQFNNKIAVSVAKCR